MLPNRNCGSRQRRRGAALVLVLIFSLGAIMLVSTMLAMTQKSVELEHEQHRQKQLAALLRAAIADSINEINGKRRDGAGYVDPDGNGPGAVGPLDGSGREVRDGDGRTLGRYRSIVDRQRTYGGVKKDVLVVAAAWPDFPDTALTVCDTCGLEVQKHTLVTAEVEIGRQRLPFGANALSLLGNYDKTKKFLDKLDKNVSLSITAPDYDVPAVNIMDDELFQQFLTDVAPELAELDGADPSNPGSPPPEGQETDTVTNDDPGIISQETLDQIRAGINDFVANAAATDIVLKDVVDKGGTLTLENGVYHIGRNGGGWDLPKGATLSGSGTLIIDDKFSIAEGATLNWDGDIIVVDDDGKKKAELKVAKDGTFTQTGGVLAVIADDASTKLTFQKDSDVTLGTTEAPVALTLIAGESKDSAKFRLHKDMDFDLVGIMTMLASKKIEFKIDKDDKDDTNPVTFTGSVVLIMVDDDGKKTELKMTIKKDQEVSFTFNGQAFDMALDELGEFFDPENTILPVKVTSYWETPALGEESRLGRRGLGLQEKLMAADPTGETWGMP